VTTPITDTAAAVELKKQELAAAEAAHLEAQKDAPPRDPAIVLEAFMYEVTMRFGHPADLLRLLTEYRATLPKEEPAPEEQPLASKAA